jgi:putative transposase
VREAWRTKKSKFTEQQIAFALQQAEGGTSGGEVCRKMGIAEATFYRWKGRACWNDTTRNPVLRPMEPRGEHPPSNLF